jgi:anti-sigma B factor antagonist
VAQGLQWVVHTGDGHAHLDLAGEVDIATAPDLREALAAVAGHPLLVVDVDGVRFCGVRGLRALLATADDRAARGGALVLARTPPHLRRLMLAMGVREHPHPVPGDPSAVAVTSAVSAVRA